MIDDLVIVLDHCFNEDDISDLMTRKRRGFILFQQPPPAIQKSSLFFYPYWYISMVTKVTRLIGNERVMNLKVMVDGIEGKAIIVIRVPEYTEVSRKTLKEVFSVEISRQKALESSRRLVTDTIIRRAFLIEDIYHTIKEGRLLYYPYWIVRTKEQLDRAKVFAINAVTGDIDYRVAYSYKKLIGC